MQSYQLLQQKISNYNVCFYCRITSIFVITNNCDTSRNKLGNIWSYEFNLQPDAHQFLGFIYSIQH